MNDLFEKRISNPNRGYYQFANTPYSKLLFPQLKGKISTNMSHNEKDCVIWSVNDYLGLASHPEVMKADEEGARQFGLAYPMGARIMTGQTELHDSLEEKLSEFVGKESTILLNFGYQGIMSSIDALVDKNDVILYDKESHACITDGIRLHIGKKFNFAHNDPEALRRRLEKATEIVSKTGGGILVVTEGVFGMRGEQGRIKEITDLKDDFDFRLYVDDAHGFGVLGEGKGIGYAQDVQNKIDLYNATFAKSGAGFGAFISGNKNIIDYLKHVTRSQLHAKTLPSAMVFGLLKRLELIKAGKHLRDKLWTNISYLHKSLESHGFKTSKGAAAVVPVYIETSHANVLSLAMDLRENYGVFCSPVGYPAAPRGVVLLRLVCTANHTKSDIDLTVNSLVEVRQKYLVGESSYSIA